MKAKPKHRKSIAKPKSSHRNSPKSHPKAASSTKAARGPKGRSPGAKTGAAAKPARESKQAQVLSLLKERAGATLEQMKALTGWQSHTVRGFISGVIKKKLGLNVSSERVADSDDRRYRIVSAASAR